jgi:hypothetical protein
MTEYCLADPNECLWLNIQTGEKTHSFPTIEAAMKFYFQRISGDMAHADPDWWLQLTENHGDTSPLAKLLSKVPPPLCQQATYFQYIPVTNIFGPTSLVKGMWWYLNFYAYKHVLFTSDYILRYDIISDKGTFVKFCVTRDAALKAVRDMPHDPEVTSYTIQEWTMKLKGSFVCTSEEVIPKEIVITI